MRRDYLKIALSTVLQFALTSASLARAEEKANPAAEEPRFIHEPKPDTEPGKKVTIRGQLTPRFEVERMVLVYRRSGQDEWLTAGFKRDLRETAVAEIPAETVESPGVEYYIYLKAEKGGDHIPLFASVDDPYLILVHGYSKNSLYEARKAEWKGRLSRVEVNYGYSDFGTNLSWVDVEGDDGASEEQAETDKGNYYHEVNVAYTYRFLTYLYALRLEIAGVAHDFADFKPFTAGKDEEIGAGMYAISPSVEFEFAKYFGASALFRLGISEEEFEGGGGMSIRVGRITSTRLDVGFEGMSHAGWRLFLKFEWDTIPYVPMSFNMERTQWYAAPTYAEKAWGSRMFYEARVNLPAGLGLRAHAGFASRDEAVKGGFVAGGGIWMDF